MADVGYSGTPLAKKLGIKPESTLALDKAPAGWSIQELPAGVRLRKSGSADVIVAFFNAANEFSPRLPKLGERIFPAGSLWIAWPRRAGGHSSDITDTVVREHVLPLGMVDVKVAALDNDWSGLKIVWRVENRKLKM